jgi:hypothetical protein
VSSGIDKILQNSGVCLRALRLYIRKISPSHTESLRPQWQEIVARTRTPDGDALSVLQYLHSLVKQGLVAWPSADSAILKLTSDEGGGRILWTLHCASYRNDSLRSRVEIPDFILRFGTKTSKTHHKIGSHLPSNERLLFDLSLQAKANFIEHTAKATIDRDPAHTISFAVTEMIDGIRKDLLHRTLTSNVSLSETAVQSIERNFRSSILHKYVELKGVKASETYERPSGRVEGCHERLWQEAAPSSTSIGKPVLLSEKLCPSTSSSATANPQHLKLVRMLEPKSEQELIDSRVQASHGIFEHGNTDILVSSSETTDLSVIARRFEEKCEQSSLKGLSSIIDGFGAVLRDTPHEHVESLRVGISPGQQSGKHQAVDFGNHTRVAEQPLQRIELWKDVSTDSIMTSLTLRLHKPFKMRFRGAVWDNRPVVVRQIEFQMTPLAVPLKEKVVVAGLIEEVQHLATGALAILDQVCDRVRFDDVIAVPKMLTEAVLRIVKPLTTSLKLDQVALSVVMGDDPVTITTTVTSEQPLDSKSTLRPYMRTPSRVRLELPPHTKSEFEQYKVWSTDE